MSAEPPPRPSPGPAPPPIPPFMGGPPGGVAAPPGGLLSQLAGASAPPLPPIVVAPPAAVLPGAAPATPTRVAANSAEPPPARAAHLASFDEVPPPTAPAVESLLEPVPGFWRPPTTPLAQRVPPPAPRARDLPPVAGPIVHGQAPRDPAQRVGDALWPLVTRIRRGENRGGAWLLLVLLFGITAPAAILRTNLPVRFRAVVAGAIFLLWIALTLAVMSE